MTENQNTTASSSLINEDLAPIPQNKRTWGTWNYAALWISMSLCIPTYMLASSLIEGGMNWWQSILTIFIGNTVVLIPMILNGHAGAKYGIEASSDLTRWLPISQITATNGTATFNHAAAGNFSLHYYRAVLIGP